MMRHHLALAGSLLLGAASVARAQATTHLNVPDTHMVVLYGDNMDTANNGNPLLRWTLNIDGVNHPQQALGPYLVTRGHSIIVTDVQFSYDNGWGDAQASIYSSLNGSMVCDFFDRTFPGIALGSPRKYLAAPFTLNSGFRIPGGQAINVSWFTPLDGTQHLYQVKLLGYYLDDPVVAK